MTPPPASAPLKKPRWQRVARVWGRAIRHRKILILTAGVLPLVAALTVAGVFYHHYATVIDRRLQGGPFQDAMNIYGAPFVLNEGDGLSAADLEAELNLAGFNKSSDGQPGTWRASGNSVEIFPDNGSSNGNARVALNKQTIGKINVSGKAAQSYTVGYPLMANLTATRDKRRMVEFSDIPPVLVNAVVSAEDKHFFKHRGVDLPRVAKAAWVDFTAGRKAQGASTLTMQLVRGLWLAPEKKWKRKVAEAFMTVHLERTWSKEKIFETYANQVYMGREAAYSIHGFAEGARTYFGKDLGAVTLPEAALLAGIVQRPSYFNPVRNAERTKQRRDLVLSLMRENKYITDDQYREAVATPLGVSPHNDTNDAFGTSYFLDQVTDELQENSASEEDARDVYTTIDLNLQQAATEAVSTGMREVDAQLAKNKATAGKHAEAALIAIDPHTGEIRAMVGGRNYGQSQLNRVLAKRPPGSVFKPFVYAAALNTGVEGGAHVYTAASTVDDTPTTFHYGRMSYTPGNFHKEHFGTMTFREALAHSDNVAAVKVAEGVGYDAVVAMARRAGLNNDIKPTPAVALGSYDVTPLEMIGAYTLFANGGRWVKPRMVSNVKDAGGDIVRSAQENSHQALDPRVAYMMTSMLEEVMRSGTAAGVHARGFNLPAAGKTGTSHDGWFAGYTSQLLCVVWVGFDDYTELNLEGAKSALPIWTEFMKRATKFGAYRNAKEFPAPSGITTATVCLQSGKLAGDFCPGKRTEQFIAGTDPQEKCDIHTDPSIDANADINQFTAAQFTAVQQPAVVRPVIAPADPPPAEPAPALPPPPPVTGNAEPQ